MRDNEGKIILDTKLAQEHNYIGIMTGAFTPTYPLSDNDYMKLHKYQNFCCAICYIRLRIGYNEVKEHDHKTDLIRGLTCFDCNDDIGKWENGHIKDGFPIQYPYRIQEYLKNPPCKILGIVAKYSFQRVSKSK